MSNIPSRSKKVPTAESGNVPPGAPAEEAVAAPVAAVPQSLVNPFAKPAAPMQKRLNLMGRYRVREGYTVALPHGKLNFETGKYDPIEDTQDGAVRTHAVAKAGELVELSHDDAVSVIRHTKDQRDPKTGRANGPAIETETAYLTRTAAEAEHARFMAEVNGVNPLDPLETALS